MTPRTLSALVLSGMLAAAVACAAPSPQCYPVCAVSCLKPWSIPDRWDDSGIPGWGGRGAYNNSYDHENFTDTNGNGIWDPGEPFVDGVAGALLGPKDGLYSSEVYDPVLTGYRAATDLGQPLFFKQGVPGVVESGQFFAVDLPGSVGADDYRDNIANCNPEYVRVGDALATENGRLLGPTKQGVKELLDKDPDAYWDPDCRCVKGSLYPGGQSPRLLVLAIHDPRIALAPGHMDVHVVKLAGFFLEGTDGTGAFKGRFATVLAPEGEPYPGPDLEAPDPGYVRDCPPARAFVRGGDRVTRLPSGKPTERIRVEPVDGAFCLADVAPRGAWLHPFRDPEGTWIEALDVDARKPKDADHDGVAEFEVSFAKDDLRPLFDAVAGRATQEMMVVGDYAGHPALVHWYARLDLDVVGSEPVPGADLVSTPERPEVTIELSARSSGAARVTIYDVRGRVVRELTGPDGGRSLTWDGQGSDGRRVRPGIYFYRPRAPQDGAGGRIVVLE